MTPLTYPFDDCEALLLDASVIVNLNATGYADRILSALPAEILIPRPVLIELRNGAAAGHTDAVDLQELLNSGVVTEYNLPVTAHAEFVSLVSGTSTQSLGDGEAATIACAHRSIAWAAIDERKARRICSARYPEITVVSTVDILAHDAVVAEFTPTEFSDAIFAALEIAHMQVQADKMDWVIGQVVPEKLQNCVSLPRKIRERVAILARQQLDNANVR